MKQFDKITPEGTKDRLFGECETRHRFAEALRALFESRGYREVATPVLEYYEVFETAGGYFPREQSYKLIDHAGRVLVLRPDCTIPIARLIGSRLKNETGMLRIFYHQAVYRLAEGNGARSGEISQMGVETIGGSLPICDVEMVELAAKSLNACCGGEYQIELCHIGYFNALLNSLDADAGRREEIRELVEHKNFPALDRLLDQFPDGPAQTALKRLPALFGSAAVLDEARSLFCDAEAARALNELRAVYNALAALGLTDHLMIDLGLVHQADYYTGILFRGYAAGAGEPVLSGGRYDGLIGAYGTPRPAIGFGINLDVLCERAIDGCPTLQAPSAAVAVDESSDSKTAFDLLERLREQGFCAELVPVENTALDHVIPFVDAFDRLYVVTGNQTREVR